MNNDLAFRLGNIERIEGEWARQGDRIVRVICAGRVHLWATESGYAATLKLDVTNERGKQRYLDDHTPGRATLPGASHRPHEKVTTAISFSTDHIDTAIFLIHAAERAGWKYPRSY